MPEWHEVSGIRPKHNPSDNPGQVASRFRRQLLQLLVGLNKCFRSVKLTIYSHVMLFVWWMPMKFVRLVMELRWIWRVRNPFVNDQCQWAMVKVFDVVDLGPRFLATTVERDRNWNCCVSIHHPHLTNLLRLVGHQTDFGPMPCPQPANLSSWHLLDGNLHYQRYRGARRSSLWTSGPLGSNTSLLVTWSSRLGMDGKGSLVPIHWDVLLGYLHLCIHLQPRMDHQGCGMGSTRYGRLGISWTYSSVSWKHSKSMKKLNWPTPLLRRLKES